MVRSSIPGVPSFFIVFGCTPFFFPSLIARHHGVCGFATEHTWK